MYPVLLSPHLLSFRLQSNWLERTSLVIFLFVISSVNVSSRLTKCAERTNSNSSASRKLLLTRMTRTIHCDLLSYASRKRSHKSSLTSRFLQIIRNSRWSCRSLQGWCFPSSWGPLETICLQETSSHTPFNSTFLLLINNVLARSFRCGQTNAWEEKKTFCHVVTESRGILFRSISETPTLDVRTRTSLDRH